MHVATSAELAAWEREASNEAAASISKPRPVFNDEEVFEWGPRWQGMAPYCKRLPPYDTKAKTWRSRGVTADGKHFCFRKWYRCLLRDVCCVRARGKQLEQAVEALMKTPTMWVVSAFNCALLQKRGIHYYDHPCGKLDDFRGVKGTAEDGVFPLAFLGEEYSVFEFALGSLFEHHSRGARGCGLNTVYAVEMLFAVALHFVLSHFDPECDSGKFNTQEFLEVSGLDAKYTAQRFNECYMSWLLCANGCGRVPMRETLHDAKEWRLDITID